MASSVSSFSACLEFVFDSNIPPSAGLNVCLPKQLRYIIFLSLGIMPIVSIALYLLVAHIDESLGR